jgi:hypothetical protein
VWVTRFETTIYNYGNCFSDKEYDPLKECTKILDQSIAYFEKANVFYKTPISTMWRKLTGAVKSTLTLQYNDLLVHVYWVNLLTRKATAIFVNTSRYNEEQKAKLTKFVLSASSFDKLPANLVTIEDGEDGTMYLDQSCYFKEEPHSLPSKTRCSLPGHRPCNGWALQHHKLQACLQQEAG